jgi:hypothetical protein
MKACAEECRKCAKACQMMVNHMVGLLVAADAPKDDGAKNESIGNRIGWRNSE